MTIDIAAKAKALVDTVLAEPANDHDIDLVQRQLGRYPRGMVAVGARCVCGRPLAVITRPVLPGGIPFPTTCYLTGPEAVKAASHVEAAGVMQQYNDMLALDEELKAAYEQAHNLYLAFRHCQVFLKNKDGFEEVMSALKKADIIKIKGSIRFDSYLNDYVMMPLNTWLWDRVLTPLAIWCWNVLRTSSNRPSAVAHWTIDQQMSHRERSIHTH